MMRLGYNRKPGKNVKNQRAAHVRRSGKRLRKKIRFGFDRFQDF